MISRQYTLPKLQITLLLLIGLTSPSISVAAEKNNISIIDRADWGGHDAKKDGFTRRQYKKSKKIKYISIHYTQSRPISKKWKENELLRFVQEGHQDSKLFGDIAYHYVIGHSGKIYKGRSNKIAPASGTHYYSASILSKAKYDSKGKLSFKSVPKKNKPEDKPGNTEDHLTVTFLLGLGEPSIFPESTMKNSAKLIAKLLVDHGLGPDAVRAHREVALTDCPGDAVYTWLRGADMKRSGEGAGMKLIRAEFAELTK